MSRPLAQPLALLVLLLPGCWKPNPLFLGAEGGTQVEPGTSSGGSGTTSEGPTTSGVTTTTGVPTTSGGLTSGGSSGTGEATGTSEPGSTGAACTPEPITIQAADDTFLVSGIPAGLECTLFGDQEVFQGGECVELDFGEQPVLSLVQGPDPIDENKERLSVYIVRFERDADGFLLETAQGPAISPDRLKSARLEVAFLRYPDAPSYSDVAVDLYAIPSPGWIQGPGAGEPCVQKAATYACSDCFANCAGWAGGGPIELSQLEYVTTQHVTPDVVEQWLTFDLDLKWFGGVANEGFLLVPAGGVLEGALVPVGPGAFRVAAREYLDDVFRPVLRVKRCVGP